MVYRMAILSAALMTGIGLTTSAYANPSASVPFVGCKSDGQVGPQDAPTGKPKIVTISPQLAQRVVITRHRMARVFSLRAAGTASGYGSDGSNLYVTPMPLNSAHPFSNSWKGI